MKGSKDLDQRFEKLLEQVKAQNSELARLKTEEKVKQRSAADAGDAADADGEAGKDKEENWLHTRDPQAARAFRVLQEDRPLVVLSGRILDAWTRRPIPARVKVVDESGISAGAEIPQVGFWCDGAFRLPVLSGNVRVEISAGRFRSTFVQGLRVEPGKPVSIEARLLRPRALDFARRGWYLADLHLALRAKRGEVPVWTGGHPRLSDAARAARAEGVQILGLALPWGLKEKQRPSGNVLAEFQRTQTPGVLMLPTYPGPQSPFCGSVLGIGVHGWDELTPNLNDPQESLRDYLEEQRRQGGLAVYTELSGRRSVNPQQQLLPLLSELKETGFYTPRDRTARLFAPAELPYDTVAGPAYDALAFDGSKTARAIWFNLLNEGYAIPIVGARGGSLEGGRAPFGRTFVKLDGPPNRERVVAACRQGRSAVSFGPAIFVKVFERDKGPGERLPADGRPLTFQIRAYASLTPGAQLEAIEIIRNGKVIHSEKTTEGLAQLDDFRFPFSEKHSAWYVVRAIEKIGRHTKRRRSAWSNPIYFDTPRRARPQPARARFRGVLRQAGGTPLSGTVTILEPGAAKRRVEIGPNGHFDVTLAAAGVLIFAAPGHEPLARRIFEAPQVQRALGALHCEREGRLAKQLSKPALFGLWRLLLSEWEADVVLPPLRTLPPAPKRPAGNKRE